MFAMGKWFWSGHGLAVVVPGTWMRIVHNDLVYMVEVPHYAQWQPQTWQHHTGLQFKAMHIVAHSHPFSRNGLIPRYNCKCGATGAAYH